MGSTNDMGRFIPGFAWTVVHALLLGVLDAHWNVPGPARAGIGRDAGVIPS